MRLKGQVINFWFYFGCASAIKKIFFDVRLAQNLAFRPVCSIFADEYKA